MTGLWALLAILLAVTPAVAILRHRPAPRGRHRGDLTARMLARRRLLVLERELGWAEQ